MGIEIERRFLGIPFLRTRKPATRDQPINLQVKEIKREENGHVVTTRKSVHYFVPTPDELIINTFRADYDERGSLIPHTIEVGRKILSCEDIEKEGIKIHDYNFTLSTSFIRWRQT